MDISHIGWDANCDINVIKQLDCLKVFVILNFYYFMQRNDVMQIVD